MMLIAALDRQPLPLQPMPKFAGEIRNVFGT